MKILRLVFIIMLMQPASLVASPLQENEAWPNLLQHVPFKNLPLTEGPNVTYIDRHKPLGPKEIEALKLLEEHWQQYPEVWASYRLKLPGNFFSVVYRVLDKTRLIHSFLVIYDSSFAVVESKEIMRQEREESYLTTFIEPYSIRINKRESSRGEHQEWLIRSSGELEKFNYFHRNVERARESLTQAWVRPLAGARLYQADGKLHDSVEFAESLRVIRHSDFAPPTMPDEEFYTVVLDYGRFLRNAQVPRQGDSLAYIRKGEVVPPVSYHTDANGKTYAGPDKHYSRMVSYSMNLEPFLEIDSVGLNNFDVLYTERVGNERYKLGEKKSWILKFDNGSQRLFKDSTYQSEYSPTSFYRLFENEAVSGDHLIYAPFFEDSYFCLLSGEDGDTLNRFFDYPFYSPNKKLVVSMSAPFTYDVEEATLELVMLKHGKYSEAIHFTFKNWNFAKDKEIHWLSDYEFLVKATAPHEFHEKQPKPFYLKFKFKPEYFK